MLNFQIVYFQLILANLLQQQKEVDDITNRSRDGPMDAELQQLVTQLRDKITILISRANHGIVLIGVNKCFELKKFGIVIFHIVCL